MTTGQEVAPPQAPPEPAEEQRVEREPPLERGPRISRAVIVASLILIGGASAVVGVLDRTRDESLILHVTNPRNVSVKNVTKIVATAPEPVAPAQRTPVVAASCTAGGSGGLRNPWHCHVRWRSGRTAAYEVHIAPNGSFIGYGRPPIHGCCIAVPRFE